MATQLVGYINGAPVWADPIVAEFGEIVAQIKALGGYLTYGQAEAGRDLVPVGSTAGATNGLTGVGQAAISGPAVIAGAVSLFAVLMKLGGPAATAFMALLRGVVGGLMKGAKVPWNMLPGPAQAILTGLGVVWGTDLLIDMGEGDIGLIQWPGTSDAPTPMLPGLVVVKRWRNAISGTWFVKFTDGRMGAQKKDGTWTIWRQPRPISVTPKSRLSTMLRADSMIDRMARKTAKMLRRRGFKVTRGAATTKKVQKVQIERGPGDIINA